MVKLSVVMVSKNAEKNIQHAIDSLEKQTYKDFEVVFIDSISTDKTIDIINACHLNKKVICEKDKGIYDGMNKGVLNSSGEIIYFLNTDDYLYNEYVFEKFIPLFKEDIILVHGATRVHYKDRERSYFFNLNDNNLRKGTFPAQQCMFFKKSILLELKLNKEYRLASDFELFCKINNYIKGTSYKIKEINTDVCFLTPGGASSMGDIGGYELGNVIMKFYGFKAYAIWRYPKLVKNFIRNILIKTKTIDFYRSIFKPNY